MPRAPDGPILAADSLYCNAWLRKEWIWGSHQIWSSFEDGQSLALKSMSCLSLPTLARDGLIRLVRIGTDIPILLRKLESRSLDGIGLIPGGDSRFTYVQTETLGSGTRETKSISDTTVISSDILLSLMSTAGSNPSHENPRIRLIRSTIAPTERELKVSELLCRVVKAISSTPGHARSAARGFRIEGLLRAVPSETAAPFVAAAALLGDGSGSDTVNELGTWIEFDLTPFPVENAPLLHVVRTMLRMALLLHCLLSFDHVPREAVSEPFLRLIERAAALVARPAPNEEEASRPLATVLLSLRRSLGTLVVCALDRYITAARSELATRLLLDNNMFYVWMDSVARSMAIDGESAVVFARAIRLLRLAPNAASRFRKVLDKSPSFPSFLYIVGRSLSLASRGTDQGGRTFMTALNRPLVEIAGEILLLWPSHARSELLVEALGSVFRGTTGSMDTYILSVFEILERENAVLVGSIVVPRWISKSSASLEKIDLQSIQTSIDWFGNDQTSQMESCDLRFLSSLILQLVEDAGVSWKYLVESNLIGSIVIQLSSDAEQQRSSSAALLDRVYWSFWNHCNVRERNEIGTILESLRSSLVTELIFPRVPKIVSLFVSRALQVAMRPAHDLFVQVNKFFLRRPSIDLDVGLLWTSSFILSDAVIGLGCSDALRIVLRKRR